MSLYECNPRPFVLLISGGSKIAQTRNPKYLRQPQSRVYKLVFGYFSSKNCMELNNKLSQGDLRF